jgi:alkylation response protein AidB-like acyl-CoA dehydrogenase
MDFGLSEDQSLFQQTVRRWLAERAPVERVRAIMESRSGTDAALLGELAEQGVTGVLVGEQHGGAGLGLLDAALLAEELGAATLPVSFHTACVMAPLALCAGGSADQQAKWLPEIASGRALVTVATDVKVRRATLEGSALPVPDAEAAAAFVVLSDEGAWLVPRETPGLAVSRLLAVDDTRRIGELTFDGVALADEMRLGCDAAAIARILDAGRIALAADALGAAGRSLERAVAYALDRKQFERVIGSFQAVKHMCAEVAAEIEPLRSLLWYAAFAWDERLPDASRVAALVKAHAGDVGVRATTATLQVFGGMGFTWECDAHLWFKRAGYDRQVLGSPTQMRERAAGLSAPSTPAFASARTPSDPR